MKFSPMRLARALDLPAHAHHARAARVLEVDGEVIVDVAVLRIGALLPPADADGPHRVRAITQFATSMLWTCCSTMWSPESQVKYSQLRICHSVSDQSGCRAVVPQPALVPEHLAADDVADRAVVDALDRREVFGLVAPLRAGDDAELLLRRRFVGGEHRADAGRIDRHRLLGEDVLAGGDRGGEMHRAEAGRRRQDHEVDVRREHFLVGVEAGVDPRRRSTLKPALYLRGEVADRSAACLSRFDARLLDAVGVQIAERGDLDALCRRSRMLAIAPVPRPPVPITPTLDARRSPGRARRSETSSPPRPRSSSR